MHMLKESVMDARTLKPSFKCSTTCSVVPDDIGALMIVDSSLLMVLILHTYVRAPRILRNLQFQRFTTTEKLEWNLLIAILVHPKSGVILLHIRPHIGSASTKERWCEHHIKLLYNLAKIPLLKSGGNIPVVTC